MSAVEDGSKNSGESAVCRFDFSGWMETMGVTEKEAARLLGYSYSYVAGLKAKPGSKRYRPTTKKVMDRCVKAAERRVADLRGVVNNIENMATEIAHAYGISRESDMAIVEMSWKMDKVNEDFIQKFVSILTNAPNGVSVQFYVTRNHFPYEPSSNVLEYGLENLFSADNVAFETFMNFRISGERKILEKFTADLPPIP